VLRCGVELLELLVLLIAAPCYMDVDNNASPSPPMSCCISGFTTPSAVFRKVKNSTEYYTEAENQASFY